VDRVRDASLRVRPFRSCTARDDTGRPATLPHEGDTDSFPLDACLRLAGAAPARRSLPLLIVPMLAAIVVSIGAPRHSRRANGLRMSGRRTTAREEVLASCRSAPCAGSALLNVASGVEGEVRDEACTSQQNNCDNDVHGYSSSNFAMADSMRVCSE